MPTSPKKSAVSFTEKPTDDLGQSDVQAKFDKANKQGFFGTVPDGTPNENYTLAGVNSDKPTPESQRGK